MSASGAHRSALVTGSLRVVGAVLAGLCFDLAGPSASAALLTWLAIGLALASFWGTRFWPGVGLGAMFGAAFWLPHISWLTLYLGPVPYLALVTVMVAWMALMGGGIALVTRHLPAMLTVLGVRARLVQNTLVAIAVASVWVLREQLQGSVPYDGFAWGRVGYPLASTGWSALVSWLGFAGFSWSVVFLTALVVGLLSHARRSDSLMFRLTPLFALALIALAWFTPVYPSVVSGTTRIAAVQGNSESAIFAGARPGDALEKHLDESAQLIGEQLDFVVWPENATDVPPQRDATVVAQLDMLTERLDAPLVTGAITERNGSVFNSSIVWESGLGVVDQYDKRQPVPFAEYMPHRSFYRALAPDLVDLVALDYTHGDGSSVIDVAGVRAGVMICFDIIFDQLARDLVDQGGQVILAQTNNADFGTTDENLQQLEISRLRAIETGRSIVVISTVGTSAIISSTGETVAKLTPHTPGHMIAEVELSETVTPAIRWGGAIGNSAQVLAVLALGLSLFAAGSKSRRMRDLFGRSRSRQRLG